MTWTATEQGTMARALVRRCDAGVLSTMSTELPGYPFGSVTPYVMTHEGRAVFYVSDIAQHTVNMKACSRTCLTVMEEGGGNRQALGRVTLVGDAAPVLDEAVTAVTDRYLAFFPEAEAYRQTHGFSFWWIEPVRVRYIGGFGNIFWVEPDDWTVPTPDWASGEAGILEHMNTDHGDALVVMARHFLNVEAETVELVAVDAEGCHLRAGGEIHYLGYAAPALTSESIREAMVALARAAREG